MKEKRRLLGMTMQELKEVVSETGIPSYASRQIADWLYKKKVTSIDEMTNISAANRAMLEKEFEIGAVAPSDAAHSVDGTIKYVYPVTSDSFIESVFIPTKEHATLCVSSQVGCKMSCIFCMTGRQGFTANLTANEIINQIQSLPERDSLTNIVFMGMGEPMDNISEVLKALEILTSSYGYGWSPKRITVSTIGARGLERFLNESSCNLAISVHSPYSKERFSIMPSEKVFPLNKVISIVKKYDFSHQRRVSFEYILFKDFNDTPLHAIALANILQDIPCRVNLIRYHALPDTSMESSEQQRMERFRDILNGRGIVATIRASRGEDIQAACGMLSTIKKEEKK